MIMIPLSMTTSDLLPRFQGHNIFRHWISRKTRRECLECALSHWWHFQWPWRNRNPVFKVMAFLKSNILGTMFLYNTNRKPHTIYLTVQRSMTLWPLTWISRLRHFLKSNIRKTTRLKDKVTIAQEESIPNIWNDTVWWPWLASKRVARVYHHQQSFFFIKILIVSHRKTTTIFYYNKKVRYRKQITHQHSRFKTFGDVEMLVGHERWFNVHFNVIFLWNQML